MARKRRGKGEGGYENLPSGSVRATAPPRKVGGKVVRPRKTFPTKAAAQEWLAKQLAAGNPPTTVVTLSAWIDTYLAIHRTRQAPGAVRSARYSLDRYARPHLGKLKLRDVTPLTLEQWFVTLGESGVGRTGLHVAGKALRAALNAAVRADLIPVNPFARVKVPAPLRPKTTAFTGEELARLLGAADAIGESTGLMLRVWAELGLRPGEAFGLRWEDFDPKTGAVRVQRTIDPQTGGHRPPKTPRVKPLPLSVDTRRRVERIRNGRTSGVMFGTPANDRHWARAYWRKEVWVPVCRAAGVSGPPKQLRHTCASLLLASGKVSILAVAERLGHSDPAMTLRVYAHAMPTDQDALAGVWGEILKSTLNPTRRRKG